MVLFFSNYIKQELPDLESIVQEDSQGDSSISDSEVPDFSLLDPDLVNVEIKCEPEAMHFHTDDSQDDSSMQELQFRSLNGDNSCKNIIKEEVPSSSPDQPTVPSNECSNEDIAFAPPELKRKKGKPKKGQERVIRGTETVLGPVVAEETSPTPDTVPDLSSCGSAAHAFIRSGSMIFPLSSPSQPQDPAVQTTSALGIGGDAASLEDGQVGEGENCGSGVKESNTPKKSIQGIHAKKLKELKQLNVKESKVTVELEKLDKLMNDEMMKVIKRYEKLRKEKIAELKEIQKEMKGVINA